MEEGTGLWVAGAVVIVAAGIFTGPIGALGAAVLLVIAGIVAAAVL